LPWEWIAAASGGIALSWGLVVWPRLAFIGLGLVTLLLGLLSIATLKMLSAPSVGAVFAGLVLLGIGAIVAHVQALLAEARGNRAAPTASLLDLGDTYPESRRRVDRRKEPRLWAEPEQVPEPLGYESVPVETVDPLGGECPGGHVTAAAVEGHGSIADDIYCGLVRASEECESAGGALLVREVEFAGGRATV
jgi:hypothetical protein